MSCKLADVGSEALLDAVDRTQPDVRRLVCSDQILLADKLQVEFTLLFEVQVIYSMTVQSIFKVFSKYWAVRGGVIQT